MRGGRWIIDVANNYNNSVDVDDAWMETLLILIGDQGKMFSQAVNGAVMNMRKGRFKICVWMKVAVNNIIKLFTFLLFRVVAMTWTQ